MASFPLLKTGAIAQYPAARSEVFQTAVHRFLDGSTQAHRLAGRGLKRWTIRLELLSETEIYLLEQFYADQQGRKGSFSFIDPFDGTIYPDCSFENDEAMFSLDARYSGTTILLIRENRS